MKPNSDATYERAQRLANLSICTISHQCRRLCSNEPEDSKFIFRRWADFEFLIIALTRLRRAANIARSIPRISSQIAKAIDEFHNTLPIIKMQRDIAKHIDKYAVNSARRQPSRV